MLYKTASEHPKWVDDAVEKCIQNRLYSANDFRHVVHYLQQNEHTDIPETITLGRKVDSPPVQTRDLNEYIVRMGGKSLV